MVIPAKIKSTIIVITKAMRVIPDFFAVLPFDVNLLFFLHKFLLSFSFAPFLYLFFINNIFIEDNLSRLGLTNEIKPYSRA